MPQILNPPNISQLVHNKSIYLFDRLSQNISLSLFNLLTNVCKLIFCAKIQTYFWYHSCKYWCDCCDCYDCIYFFDFLSLLVVFPISIAQSVSPTFALVLVAVLAFVDVSVFADLDFDFDFPEFVELVELVELVEIDFDVLLLVFESIEYYPDLSYVI